MTITARHGSCQGWRGIYEEVVMRLSTRCGIAGLLVLALLAGTSPSYSQLNGIAKKYVRDAGIEQDPDVVMADMFEGTSIAQITSRWTSSDNAAGMSLNSDLPPGSGGSRSLLMTSVGGTNSGAQLYKKLVPGYEQLYLRYYVKYASANTYHHAGGWMGGYNPPTDWPQGGAGGRPTGTDRFSIGPEPVNAALKFDLYTYWMGMRPSPTGDYWGNIFIQNPNLAVKLDQWMCIEVMVKMNNPVSSNSGELALWVDGVQAIHLREGSPIGLWTINQFKPDPSGSPFEGFRWRSTSQLNLNWIWLLYYTTGNPQGFVGKVWFDHVVLATKYIGPINTSAVSDAIPPAAPTLPRVQ
jgi:hypothetical protein